ncbi:MAG: VIT domain-containing protein [Planctomycetota bacterium]
MRLLAPLLYVVYAAVVPLPPQEPTLKQSDAVAKVRDLQGTGYLRPVTRDRWTPVAQRDLVMPGDLIRTSPWGANAVELALTGGGSLLIGPGSLVELPEAGRARLLYGECELAPAEAKEGEAVPEKARPVAVGPGGFEQRADKPLVLRAGKGRTEVLAEAPRWLTGYRASTTDEWMGSLIAKVDGREVPLSVGYHKVTVEVRDQIARTTIEQSFRNDTKETLEGRFYFPLPADASISGFGMWIGNELVEADIVEKQRARQIYEDLLRQKKDPGLLEWAGGNLFQARVFPIFGHSEKRVRIRYTQVLPLEGRSFRYSYALRSELLRKHPLRELSIRVRVLSSTPIAKVECTSHEVLTRTTDGTAMVTFDAKEYSPDKDFALTVELARPEPLKLVSHQRGEDGYFMLLFTPPSEEAQGWQRELLPEGKPLEVVVVADTSASMSAADREVQREALAALLTMLGDKDRFRLMACDWDARWFSAEALPATDENAARALAWLDGLTSLGWTDLDRAFGEVFAKAGDGATVLYLGDGIGTSGDGDPVALARRLEKAASGKRVTCHAISTGATYEVGVLQALATIGGGSVREAGEAPARTVQRLLAEAARPSYHDLSLEIAGLRAAAVHPAALPNLPAGAQQAVLGRFLPGPGEQRGKATLRGKLGDEEVRFATDFALQAGEEGNSFLPRLWARRHLDSLLAQGRSPRVVEDIVAFSQEYQVMTPYTSFLVLDSDEQREQYGVERQVRMRDGERFFAEAKDAVDQEAAREQMRLARQWRLALRHNMLREIASLGLDLPIFEGAIAEYVRDFDVDKAQAAHLGFAQGNSELLSRGLRGGGGGPSTVTGWDGGAEGGELFDDEIANDPRAGGAARKGGYRGPGDAAPGAPPAAKSEEALEELELQGEAAGEPAMTPALDQDFENLSGKKMRSELARRQARPAGRMADARSLNGAYDRYNLANQQRMAMPADPGFPYLPPVVEVPPDHVAEHWPAEVRATLALLARREAMLAAGSPFELEWMDSSLHPVQQVTARWTRTRVLYDGEHWLVTNDGPGQAPELRFRDARRLAAVNTMLDLARVRPTEAADRRMLPIPTDLAGVEGFERTYRRWTARVLGRDGALVTLLFESPELDGSSLRLVVDTGRKVLVSREDFQGEEKRSSMRFSGFVDVAGLTWPTRCEVRDDEDRRVRSVEFQVRAATADAAAKAFADASARVDAALTLPLELPDLADARQADFEGKAGVAERWRVLAHEVVVQMWPEAWKAFEALAATCGQAGAGKDGVAWVRLWLQSLSRRGPEFLAAARARDLAGAPLWPGLWLADRIEDTAAQVLGPNERLELHEGFAALAKADGEDRERRLRAFERRRASLLDGCGRSPEARAIRRSLHEADPKDFRALVDHLGDLTSMADFEAAIALDREALGMAETWAYGERQWLHVHLTDRLWDARDLEGLEEHCAAWVAERPEGYTARQRLLSALLHQGKLDEADAWARGRAAVAPTDDEPVLEDVRAAVQYMLGQGWNWNTNVVLEQFHGTLKDIALAWMRAGVEESAITAQVLGNWRFNQLQAARDIRATLLAELAAEGKVAALEPRHLRAWIDLLGWDGNSCPEADFERVATALRRRWTGSDDARERWLVGNTLVAVLDRRGKGVEALAFLRERRGKEDERYAPALAQDLWRRLRAQPWTAEVQAELVALLPDLVSDELPPKTVGARWGQVLRELCEGLEAMRYTAELGPPEEHKELSREALRQKQKDARVAARRGLREVLAGLGALPEAAAPWRALELLTVDTRLLAADAGEKPELHGQVLDRALALLDALPTDDEAAERQDLVTYRERALRIAAYACVRKGAPEGLGDKLLEALDARGAKHPDLHDWRFQVARLLIVLDRPGPLEKRLTSWIAPGRIEGRWRVLLAYLQAELGRLDEALATLDQCATLTPLGAAQWTAMSAWALVVGDDQRRAKALFETYRARNEWDLNRELNRRWSALVNRPEGGAPGEFDSETLIVMKALLAKASYPQNQLGSLWRFYERTKDFRVLAAMADGAVGLTRDRSYDYLATLGQFVAQVHEEATCDELRRRLDELTEAARSAQDRRALLLIRAQVEARAGLVRNQPGPHIERAVAAMKQAFELGFDDQERIRMARYLLGLGKVSDPKLDAERFAELAALEEQCATGSRAHLQVADAHAATRWLVGRRQEALDWLAAAAKEYRNRHGGWLDASDRGPLVHLVEWNESLDRFVRAEEELMHELGGASNLGERHWLDDRLWQCRLKALAGFGDTTLGRGEALYDAARAALLEGMWSFGAGYVQSRMQLFCNLHLTAHKARIRKAAKQFEEFAYGSFTTMLDRCPPNAPWLGQLIGNTVKQLSGARQGLDFLVTRIEHEPTWYPRAGLDLWGQYGWEIARWRAEAGGLGDLEPRLLRLVLAALEDDLANRSSRGSTIYRRGRYFWSAKRDEFRRVARKVLELEAGRIDAVNRTAQYLWNDLGERDEAVAALVAADGKELLDVGGTQVLARWLMELRRYDQALTYVRRLVERAPLAWQWRVMEFAALAGMGKKDEALAHMQAAEGLYRERGAWHPQVMAAFGQACRQGGLLEQAVGYYTQAITAWEPHKRRGGDGTLAQWYEELAEAHAGLGHTAEAVDAVSKAILTWGSNAGRRNQAVGKMHDLLVRAKGLDDWLASYDAEVERSGVDAPLLRKVLGKVFLERREAAKAVGQLVLARELQPGDEETCRLLVEAHDRLGQKAEAIAVLLDSLPHVADPIATCAELGRRMRDLGEADQAERALTSMVELRPAEAASHEALAKVREGEGKPAEALTQWERVVEIRTDEPDGWFGVVRTLRATGKDGEARDRLEAMLERKWDPRFPNVKQQAARC